MLLLPSGRNLGKLNVQSHPPHAINALDGVALRQKSPADLDGLPPGTFTAELARPGAKPRHGELRVVRRLASGPA